ncbi:MAG: hypothetical protein M3O50_16650 [Myxococcota bacterium]|nr:hypothetical protein [Myxococcota bacterium]
MVRGLFHAAEHEAVLSLLEKSVVFLSVDNIESVLRRQSWLHSAWDLANLYLSSVDAELLGPEAPSLLRATCVLRRRRSTVIAWLRDTPRPAARRTKSLFWLRVAMWFCKSRSE